MSSIDVRHLSGEADETLPLLVLLGPTAVGKTELSVQLAERVSAEIISADSRLFYRGMDIGTAKPSIELRQRVVHHLIDVAEPDETWSLAKYVRVVHRLIEQIHFRQNLPMLVGGTGQYLRAIYEGWKIPAQKPDPALRQAIENWGKELGPKELHRRLHVLDPQAATRIEPNNLRRTVRALEVIYKTGRRFSEQKRRSLVSPYHTLIIGLTLPREELYARIDLRINQMLEQGWMEEVRQLLQQGYTPDLPGMSAIGYPQLAQVFQGEMQLGEAIQEIRRLTRQFVRRQANWFKLSDPRIHWFTNRDGVIEDIIGLIKQNFGDLSLFS
jgi:tRNA dimethylallyltransferase